MEVIHFFMHNRGKIVDRKNILKKNTSATAFVSVDKYLSTVVDTVDMSGGEI